MCVTSFFLRSERTRVASLSSGVLPSKLDARFLCLSSVGCRWVAEEVADGLPSTRIVKCYSVCEDTGLFNKDRRNSDGCSAAEDLDFS